MSILEGGYPYFKKNFDLIIEEGEFRVGPITNYKAKTDLSIIANRNEILKSMAIIII